ncbi:MAG TPA: trypsin-like peptidase domain-containing protein [Acidimicrobiales bacterium]|nr:trypsin-like peptidase domain-containing protein [Acidimicrobiales bacterium]
MTVWDEWAQVTGEIGSRVGPGVVRIGRDNGRGAGMVVGEGRILTNAHNLRGRQTTVTFSDGRSTMGEVVGLDGAGDLSVLSADTGAAPALEWRPGDDPPVPGTAVWAVTTPEGGGLRVTGGWVSAVGRAFRGPGGRWISGGLEHTVPLARGSSGGPLVDAGGALVGINTHRLGEGFYLAVPADTDLRKRVDALARGESPLRHHLGVAIAPAEAARRLREAVGLPPREGLLVRAVEEGSPAATAGIHRGDLLVSAGGRHLGRPADLFAALDAVPAGAALEVGLVRGVEEVTVQVAFGPDAAG